MNMKIFLVERKVAFFMLQIKLIISLPLLKKKRANSLSVICI
jgi:hypothetical protein